MNMLDKLLGLGFVEDLAESSWWTDTIFRGLEQDGSEEKDIVGGASAPSSERSTTA
jgi:hypothetical protein